MKFKTAERLQRTAEVCEVKLPESEYYWGVGKNEECLECLDDFVVENSWNLEKVMFPDFTTDELLKWLPIDIIIWRDSKEKYFAKRDGYDENFSGKSPSEALAELAIILIKKGILK